MTQRAYEWVPRPPTNRERMICGIWLAAFVVAMANFYAGWRLFRGYDNWVFGGLLLASFFLFARLPGVRRVECVQRPLTYWLIIGLGLAGAIILWLLSSRN
jgi:hypothetical protein